MPEGWEWCPIDELGIVITGTTPPKSDMSNYGDEYPFYKPTDLDNGINTITAGDNLSAHGYEKARKLPINSILVTCIGATIGKTGLIRRSGSCNQQINAIVPHAFVIPEYLYYCCVSEYGQDIIISNASSTTLPILNKTKFSELLFPLPSKAEQERILKVIHCYLEIIEDIENKDEELHKLIQSSKVKIIDLALHGKLVPQDPSDEPAIELLKRINPTFKSSDNLHYEGVLPSGWVLCRLEDIIEYEQPQAYIVESTDYSDKFDVPVLTPGKSFILGYTNESRGICNRLPVIIFDDFTTESKYVDFPFKVKSSAMKILRVKDAIDIRYIAFFMSITRLASDTHKRYWISEYSKLSVPLPPLQEQKRIVSKVTELSKQLNLLLSDIQRD